MKVEHTGLGADRVACVGLASGPAGPTPTSPRPTATPDGDARRRAMQMHAVPAARPPRRLAPCPVAACARTPGKRWPRTTKHTKCLRSSLSPIVSSAYQHPNAQLMSINLRPSVARGPCTSSRAPTALHRRREDDAHARHDVRTRKLGASRRCHSDHVRAEYDARARTYARVQAPNARWPAAGVVQDAAPLPPILDA